MTFTQCCFTVLTYICFIIGSHCGPRCCHLFTSLYWLIKSWTTPLSLSQLIFHLRFLEIEMSRRQRMVLPIRGASFIFRLQGLSKCFFQQLALMYTSSASLWPPSFPFPPIVFFFLFSAFMHLQRCSATSQGCHKKKKRNNKIFSCVLGFVLQSYLTKHEISFSRPKSLPTPLPTSGLFILLWFWEVVSESLMICCVCSSYPSTHYSSTHLLPTDLNAKGVTKIHFFPFHMN